jgi:hypothetical protein
VRFRFTGKSGKQWSPRVLRDRRIAKIIRTCQELPGQELLQYLDDEGKAAGRDFKRRQCVSRFLKYIVRARIFEFESHHPSQAVQSPPGKVKSRGCSLGLLTARAAVSGQLLFVCGLG